MNKMNCLHPVRVERMDSKFLEETNGALVSRCVACGEVVQGAPNFPRQKAEELRLRIETTLGQRIVDGDHSGSEKVVPKIGLTIQEIVSLVCVITMEKNPNYDTNKPANVALDYSNPTACKASEAPQTFLNPRD